jgi:hypothetical protein
MSVKLPNPIVSVVGGAADVKRRVPLDVWIDEREHRVQVTRVECLNGAAVKLDVAL